MFIPTTGSWNSYEENDVITVGIRKGTSNESEQTPHVTSNNIVDIFPMKSECCDVGGDDIILLAVIVQGEVLLSRTDNVQFSFHPILNLLQGLPIDNPTYITSVIAGFNLHVFVAVCSNG